MVQIIVILIAIVHIHKQVWLYVILRKQINNAFTRRCALNLYFDSLADL